MFNNCGKSIGDEIDKLNVIFIVIDTLRADFLGCYSGRAKTPNIDEIARKGIIFNNAFSASDFTAPSFLSIFSGLYPSEHGMINWSKKSKRIPLINNLVNNGYKVQGFTSFRFIKQLLQNSMDIKCVGSDFGEYWDVNQHLMVTEQALRFLEKNKKNTFFLFIHHSATHAPYRFPKYILSQLKKDKGYEFYYNSLKSDNLINAIFPQMNNENLDKLFQSDDEAKEKSSIIAKVTTGITNLEKNQANFINYLYKKEVEWTDILFGKILDKLTELELHENTIICFLSDHGELLFEQGKFGHANDYMTNEVLKIPWLLYFPNLNENKTVETIVSHVNIMPTILEIIGLKLDDRLKKRSLWSALLNNKQIVPKPVYSEGNYRIAVIKNDVKYVTDTKRKSQFLGLKDFMINSLRLLVKLPNSINKLKLNFKLFMIPYYKRLKGISKEQLNQLDSINKIEKPIVKNRFRLKKEMSDLIDEYYNMEKVNLTEELSEDELEIIKVRLEALGYLVRKQK